ncbi:MAG: GNAT family N-acetyltransferase [Marinovum sp.]|nr:GNAT family N-acetyltransferase [Marinovum sp.]
MNQNVGDTLVSTRLLHAEDRAQWADLWTAYLTFYETSLPPSIYNSTFDRLIDPAQTTMYGHLAWMDGQAVGLVHYLYHDHCWKTGQVCYLQDLYTTSEARGRGVGQALIQSVYGAADAQDAQATYWLTQSFNTTARRLYDEVAECTPFIKYQRG